MLNESRQYAISVKGVILALTSKADEFSNSYGKSQIIQIDLTVSL